LLRLLFFPGTGYWVPGTGFTGRLGFFRSRSANRRAQSGGKAEGGIPGPVFALLEPTPVSCEEKQEPGGKAEGPGKMRSGVVDGDDQVEGRDLGRENVQVGQLVNGEIDEKGRIGLVRFFLRCVMIAVLQADPTDIRLREEGSELR